MHFSCKLNKFNLRRKDFLMQKDITSIDVKNVVRNNTNKNFCYLLKIRYKIINTQSLLI